MVFTEDETFMKILYLIIGRGLRKLILMSEFPAKDEKGLYWIGQPYEAA